MKKRIAIIAMLGASILCKAQTTEYPIKLENQKINNSPWYGLGQSSVIFPNTTYSAMQLAGYYGILLKTGTGNFAFDYHGNFGVGTINPKSKLDLGTNHSNPSVFPNKITLWSGGENNYFGFGISSADLDYFSQGNHRFYTEYNGTPGSEKMVIESNGNIGIGTTVPSNKVHVEGNTGIRVSGGAIDQFFLEGERKGVGVNFRLYDNNNTIYYDSRASMTFRANQLGGSNGSINLMGGKVGIGTWSPSAKLHIKSNDSSPEATLLRLDNSGTRGSASGIEFYSSTTDSEGANRVGRISGKFDGGSFTNARLSFHSMTTSNVLVETISLKNGEVGIGTTNPNGWKLAVNGKIRAKEIKVETGWSDFVFYDDYELPTLEEVESHIKEKGHLKDIPSAKEVERNGIFLGEMNAKLLQKIEELTLYIIEQGKEIKELKKQNIKIEKQNSKLGKQQEEIEKLKTLLNRLLNKKK